MTNRDELLTALAPILDAVQGLDLSRPDDARHILEQKFPMDGPVLRSARALLREGVKAGWLCDRENGGVRFSRVKKSGGADLSIDAVHMSTPGPGHTHPNGEVDLCFAVSGAPRFDGRPEGWTVYPPGSWHVPTVDDGVMDILYFLPGGAIQFGPRSV